MSLSVADILNAEADVVLQVSGSDSFRDSLVNRLQRFKAHLDNVDTTSPIGRLVGAWRLHSETLSEGLIQSLDRYAGGRPAAAYGLLSAALTSVMSAMRSLYTIELPPRWFRIRPCGSQSGLRRKDMFHPPFEIRHRIATQRFSISGFPCLYLGSSLGICWEELGCPAIQDVHASEFRPTGNDMNVLDLAFRPIDLEDIARGLAANPRPRDLNQARLAKFIASYVVLFPLHLACLQPVSCPVGSPFKVEYVVPQMLMQWIAEQDEVFGVRYRSTRVERSGLSGLLLGCNLAIPARMSKSEGYCDDLMKRFMVAGPIHVASPAPGLGSLRRDLSDRGLKIVEPVEGLAVPYTDTSWGRYEQTLDILPFGTI